MIWMEILLYTSCAVELIQLWNAIIGKDMSKEYKDLWVLPTLIYWVTLLTLFFFKQGEARISALTILGVFIITNFIMVKYPKTMRIWRVIDSLICLSSLSYAIYILFP